MAPNDWKSRPTIHSLDFKWQETGPEFLLSSRLLASIEICGTPMHLEAWEVKKDEEGVYRAISWPEAFELAYQGLMSEGEWETTIINGREYVLLAQPYGR